MKFIFFLHTVLYFTTIFGFQEKIYYPYSFESIYTNPKLWEKLEKKPYFQKIIKDECHIKMQYQERLLGYTFMSQYDIVKEPYTLSIFYHNKFLENNVTFLKEEENDFINVSVSTTNKVGIPKTILKRIIHSKMKHLLNETLS
jgi:hypothetical protein